MLKLLIVNGDGWGAHNTMHINAAMSDCSPPGVSQMSVNIQLFPLHLTLISLWWHFISPPLAVLLGKRSTENSVFVLFIPSAHKKMQKQINKTKISLSWCQGWTIWHMLLWTIVRKVPNHKWTTDRTIFFAMIVLIEFYIFSEDVHNVTWRTVFPPPLQGVHCRPTFFMSGRIGGRSWWFPSAVNLFFSRRCISIQMKTSCQSK